MSEPATADTVVIPAGRPIGEAAAWVGQACWVELRLHQVLTGWLAVEADDEQRIGWWTLRSHRAEMAEAWHRRLPELTEWPRGDFVAPSSVEVADHLDRLAGLVDPSATDERTAGLGAALADLTHRYRDHQRLAAGPADAPVAATLAVAIERTERDAVALGAIPAVDDTAKVAEGGVTPPA
jgi:hypothetical protein